MKPCRPTCQQPLLNSCTSSYGAPLAHMHACTHARMDPSSKRSAAEPAPAVGPTAQTERDEAATAGPGAPCGACKFLRRRCVPGCVFAPHFGGGREHGRGGGAARFAAVHKVFGASNVAKLLARVPVALRRDAARTISYEAQARLADPVYGCVGTILALQHQVALLEAELSIVQSQLINSRLAFESTHSSSHHFAVLQPAYSTNSSASNQMMINYGGLPTALDFADAEPSSRGLEPLQLSQPFPDEDEEDSQNLVVFSGSVGK